MIRALVIYKFQPFYNHASNLKHIICTRWAWASTYSGRKLCSVIIATTQFYPLLFIFWPTRSSFSPDTPSILKIKKYIINVTYLNFFSLTNIPFCIELFVLPIRKNKIIIKSSKIFILVTVVCIFKVDMAKRSTYMCECLI